MIISSFASSKNLSLVVLPEHFFSIQVFILYDLSFKPPHKSKGRWTKTKQICSSSLAKKLGQFSLQSSIYFILSLFSNHLF